MSSVSSQPGRPAKYRAERLIGRGGMANVYKGTIWFPDRERRCAFKCIREDKVNDYTLKAFLREASLGYDLGGEAGLLRVYDYHLGGDGPFIVMEYVEGPAVRDVLPVLRGYWAMIRRIALDVLSALRHVHAHGIVHRDVSPGNILLDRRGAARLCDLGLARPEAGPQTEGTRGTIAYTSPEMLRDCPATSASDVYGLGAVLYELIADRPPYGEHIIRVLANQAEPLPALPDDAPADLARLIPWMLRLEPEARPGIDEAVNAVTGPVATDADIAEVADAWIAGRPEPGNAHDAAAWELALGINELPPGVRGAFLERLSDITRRAADGGIDTDEARAIGAEICELAGEASEASESGGDERQTVPTPRGELLELLGALAGELPERDELLDQAVVEERGRTQQVDRRRFARWLIPAALLALLLLLVGQLAETARVDPASGSESANLEAAVDRRAAEPSDARELAKPSGEALEAAADERADKPSGEALEAAADARADKPTDADGERAERADEAPPIDSIARQVDGVGRKRSPRSMSRGVSPDVETQPLRRVRVSEFEGWLNH